MTIVKGTKGDDILSGSVGDDILKGRKGDDVLIGAAGADAMKGGKGADIFVVSYGDRILDFKPGVDKIVIDQPYDGQLYQDSTGLYAGYDVIGDHPTDLIVKADGVVWFGSGDLLNA